MEHEFYGYLTSFVQTDEFTVFLKKQFTCTGTQFWTE